MNLLKDKHLPNWQKIFYYFLLFTFFVIISVASIVFIIRRSNRVEIVEICNRTECIGESKRIINSINFSIDPCENFYSYSCDIWVKNNPIPDNYPWFGQFEIIQQNIDTKILEILESNLTNYPEILRKSQKFYRSCLNFGKENTKFQNFVNSFVPQKNEKSNWGQIFGKVRSKFGVNILAGLSVQERLNKSSLTFNNYIVLDTHNIGIFGKNFTPEYYDYMKNNWPLAYPNTTLYFDELVQFNQNITQILNTSLDKTLYRTTIESFNVFFGQNTTIFDWNDFFLEAFSGTRVNLDISNQMVLFSDTDYLQNFTKVLEQTDDKIIQNYILWRVLQEHGPHVNSEINQNFKNVFKIQSRERSKNCLDITMEYFDKALYNPYVKKHFPQKIILKVNIAVDYIKKAALDIVSNSNEVNYIDKLNMINRLNQMKVFIGFPQWILDLKKLNKFYSRLVLKYPNDYYRNYYDVSKWASNKALEEILNPIVDNSKWKIDMKQFVAYYIAFKNAMYLPLRILQKPIFGMLTEQNFGGLGFYIGHELSHGLEELIQSHSKCLENQYGDFLDSTTGLKINGSKSLTENWADNFGLKLAFDAYKTFSNHRKSGAKVILDGLQNFTSEQILFISYAQSWCTSYTTQGLKHQIEDNSFGHIPIQYRVQGTIQNSIDFQNSFKCRQKRKICKIY